MKAAGGGRRIVWNAALPCDPHRPLTRGGAGRPFRASGPHRGPWWWPGWKRARARFDMLATWRHVLNLDSALPCKRVNSFPLLQIVARIKGNYLG